MSIQQSNIIDIEKPTGGHRKKKAKPYGLWMRTIVPDFGDLRSLGRKWYCRSHYASEEAREQAKEQIRNQYRSLNWKVEFSNNKPEISK